MNGPPGRLYMSSICSEPIPSLIRNFQTNRPHVQKVQKVTLPRHDPVLERGMAAGASGMPYVVV